MNRMGDGLENNLRGVFGTTNPPPTCQLELLPTTQTAAILSYLRSGSPLTPLEALHKFGCFRLAARCADLRRLGYRIETQMVAVGGGKHVASYRLKP